MNVIKMSDLFATDRMVRSPDHAFTSYRPLLESDGMGFTLTLTIVQQGGPWKWHYKNHLEACYCIKGRATLTDLSTGERHHIEKHVLYALDKHDAHTFEAHEDTHLICIFNPPLKGGELHREDGSYE